MLEKLGFVIQKQHKQTQPFRFGNHNREASE